MAEPFAPVGVIGGSGFVGSRLVARLADAGIDVLVPTRDPWRARHLTVQPRVRVVRANVHDPASLDGALSGCASVVNLVGILNEKGRDGSGFSQAHAGLVGKLIAACGRSGISRLVQVSALNAGAPAATSHYLRSKGEAEVLIRQSQLRWTILQPSVIFGPGDSFLNRFATLTARVPLAFPLAMPAARFAPVHVDDVAAAIRRVLENDATAGRTYQVCGPEVLTLAEIVSLVLQAGNRRRRVIGLPRWLSRLQAAVMDFVPGKPFSTDNYRSLLLDSVCAEPGLAMLGIQPRTLSGSLRDCLVDGFSRRGSYRQGASS
jgi:NADH dehydrogenase